MDNDLPDIYGFTDFPDYLNDDVLFDDMLAADIDMCMSDKVNDCSTVGHGKYSTGGLSPPRSQSISSPIINPDDFLNDVDGEDGLTTGSDRSSPSVSHSPSSPSSLSLDNIKNESSSDESVQVETPPAFVNYMPPTQIFPTQNGPIRIFQGTLIPVSTIKIEPPTGASAQPIVFGPNTGFARNSRSKVVLPKLNASATVREGDGGVQHNFVDSISEKALKKQQRMIKNRESASISRTKKREYVMSLETRVRSLLAENNVLKHENTNLRAQISNMLASCQCRVAQYNYFTKTISPQTRKNVTILLAMVFMVSMSFGNFNTLLARQNPLDDSALSPNPDDHIGRSLLWTKDYDYSSDDTDPFKNVSRTIKCLNALNQTENRRIESDLRNWIGIGDGGNATHNPSDIFMPGFHNIFNPSFKSYYRAHKNYFKRKNPHLNQDSLEFKKRRFSGQQGQRAQKLKNPMQVFNPSRRSRRFSKLFEEIGRRNDTFYVLSFNNDHLLLSAANHNKSARPRMSFVLPTDDSFESDKVVLMQIDCEVMNTSVIEVKKEFIPQHLRTPTATKYNGSTNVPRNNSRSFNVPNKHDIFDMVNRSNRLENREKHDYSKIYKPYFIDKKNFAKDSSGDFSEVFLT